MYVAVFTSSGEAYAARILWYSSFVTRIGVPWRALDGILYVVSGLLNAPPERSSVTSG